MPVVVWRGMGDRFAKHAELAVSTWDLREQVEALEAWMHSDKGKLDPSSRWVADIGFAPRKGALGGGPPLTLGLMEACLAANLEIFLSEYPRVRNACPTGDELRASMLEAVRSGSSALLAAEKYLLAEAEDDLNTYANEPDDDDYIKALLLKELLQKLPDSEAKRLFVLHQLHEAQSLASEGLPGPLADLIAALRGRAS